MNTEIWIAYHSNVTGDTEHICNPKGWSDAKAKATQIVENEILYCEFKVAAQILAELSTDSWRKAVKLFNKSNYRRNDIRFYSKNPYKEL